MGLNSCRVPGLSNLWWCCELSLKHGELLGQDMKADFANPLSVTLRYSHLGNSSDNGYRFEIHYT